MEMEETKLKPPDEFPFPFTPYSIQKDLMRSLYETFEEKKLGIFESPTGTGKSMSLLCGSLQWLFDAEKRIKEDVVTNIKKLNKELQKNSTGIDWLDEHASKTKIKQKRDSLQDLLTKLSDREDRLEEIKTKAKKISEKEKVKLKSLKAKIKDEGDKPDEVDDWDFVLDEYALEERLNDESSESDVEGKEKYYGIKVFFCSRTHSQLSQLVQEVKKSPFKELNIRVVSLASRQNYCINESVLNLKHLPLINERCQELHKKKNKGKSTKVANERVLKRQKTTGGCPFYNQTNINNASLKILTEIQDVEELVLRGRDLRACPYYASRSAINEAQLVLVPYNTILHRSTREAYGIDLKNSIVIVDEAHNLLDTIGNIHSALVSGLQLAHCYSQLVQYRERYSERFSAVNLLHLNQLIFVVNKLLRKVGGKGDADPNLPSGDKSVIIETLAEFVLSAEIDSINLHKVLEFVSKSNVSNKVRGFLAAYGSSVVIHKKEEEKGVSAFLKKLGKKKGPEPEEGKPEDADSLAGNSLVNVVNFIQSLTNHCLDGRVVCCRSNTVATSSLKYLLLNPATHFSDIVKDARSVVLAGGTMQPISEFTDQLFYLAGGTSDRISVFTCGHVIPECNILPIITSSGPSGKVFDFSYQQRNNAELLDELGRLLVNVCNVVPSGVVCFFTSYEYEAFVYQRLLQTKVLDKITCRKKVLREPKKANKVDEVLKDYAAAVKSGGALLFSVVGGKLSEGLNFSDDLGRCVIVVGLPYPNLTSLELKEKMNYLDAEVGPAAGKTYYENLCMKAVNQSIGRSVRHKDDYASVLLVDQRYSRPKCVKALPEWIQKSLRREDSFGPVMGHLGRFFSAKKKPA